MYSQLSGIVYGYFLRRNIQLIAHLYFFLYMTRDKKTGQKPLVGGGGRVY